jgi:hypothetical protein
MNFEVVARDADGAPCFHAERVYEDREPAWRFSGRHGLMSGTRKSCVTALADMMGTVRISRITAGPFPVPTDDGLTTLDLFLDALGNAWEQDNYVSPAMYLPTVFPPASSRP